MVFRLALLGILLTFALGSTAARAEAEREALSPMAKTFRKIFVDRIPTIRRVNPTRWNFEDWKNLGITPEASEAAVKELARRYPKVEAWLAAGSANREAVRERLDGDADEILARGKVDGTMPRQVLSSIVEFLKSQEGLRSVPLPENEAENRAYQTTWKVFASHTPQDPGVGLRVPKLDLTDDWAKRHLRHEKIRHEQSEILKRARIANKIAFDKWREKTLREIDASLTQNYRAALKIATKRLSGKIRWAGRRWGGHLRSRQIDKLQLEVRSQPQGWQVVPIRNGAVQALEVPVTKLGFEALGPLGTGTQPEALLDPRRKDGAAIAAARRIFWLDETLFQLRALIQGTRWDRAQEKLQGLATSIVERHERDRSDSRGLLAPKGGPLATGVYDLIWSRMKKSPKAWRRRARVAGVNPLAPPPEQSLAGRIVRKEFFTRTLPLLGALALSGWGGRHLHERGYFDPLIDWARVKGAQIQSYASEVARSPFGRSVEKKTVDALMQAYRLDRDSPYPVLPKLAGAVHSINERLPSDRDLFPGSRQWAKEILMLMDPKFAHEEIERIARTGETPFWLRGTSSYLSDQDKREILKGFLQNGKHDPATLAALLRLAEQRPSDGSAAPEPDKAPALDPAKALEALQQVQKLRKGIHGLLGKVPPGAKELALKNPKTAVLAVALGALDAGLKKLEPESPVERAPETPKRVPASPMPFPTGVHILRSRGKDDLEKMLESSDEKVPLLLTNDPALTALREKLAALMEHPYYKQLSGDVARDPSLPQARAVQMANALIRFATTGKKKDLRRLSLILDEMGVGRDRPPTTKRYRLPQLLRDAARLMQRRLGGFVEAAQGRGATKTPQLRDEDFRKLVLAVFDEAARHDWAPRARHLVSQDDEASVFGCSAALSAL